MDFELGFGKTVQRFSIPDANLAGVLTPNAVSPADTATAGCTGEEAVRRALDNPIGAPPLEQVVKTGERVAVITSDITRPLPSYLILPPVLERLYRAGVRPADITVVFALGSHRRHSPEEMRKLVGDSVYESVRCVDSTPSHGVLLGTTGAGTPVEITEPVASADRRICLGNIEYHYFAGYSGGAKALMPGVSTRKAISCNHSRMTHQAACAGSLDHNPVRQDIEEAVRFCSIDYIVNVVLSENKEILYAVAGHHVQAHRDGCAFLDALYLKPIGEQADIVVVSQGGYPKDINLYQTQKALDNAKHAVKKGGTVILVGSCAEGLGESVFERWMLEAKHPRDLTERIERDFQLGGHKAAAIAMVLENSDIWLVSDLDPGLTERLFMKPFASVSDAVQAAFEKYGSAARVLVMPYGGSTLPRLRP